MNLGYMDHKDVYELFCNIRNFLGDETVISEVMNFFSTDKVKDFCESLMTDYEIEPTEVGLETDEEEEDDE